MKRIILSTFIAITLFVSAAYAQDAAELPSVKVKDLYGNAIDSKDFSNDGKPFVINFWATWCKPCLIELNAINEYYDIWKEETGVKFIAVSIDDSRNSKKVPGFVKGRGWGFEFYIDENQDLKRELNVNNPPHTFLCDGDGKIVWQHNGYAPGDEEELFQKIQELTDKDE